MKRNITFGVIYGSRNIFNPALTVSTRDKIRKVLLDEGINAIEPQNTRSRYDVVETLEDAKLCAQCFSDSRNEISGVLVVLSNFGDEIGVAETLRRASLNVPVLVFAADDDPARVDIHSRRDAFCGKLSVCNNLRQYGIRFSLTANHTSDPEDPVFKEDLRRFAAVCRVVDGLSHARIAQFGIRPAGFQTVRYSEKLLERSGITVVPVDFASVISRAESIMKENPVQLERIRAEIKGYARVSSEISAAKINRLSAFTLAIRMMMDELDCQASAVKCWDSLQYQFGCAACTAMSIESEGMRPSACEGDVAGAVSMLALSLASSRPSALLDWNNNYGESRDLCVSTHCSSFPKDFFSDSISISHLDILGNTIGPDLCFGAVKGMVAPGHFTYFRISTDDANGRIISYVGEGEFLERPFPMDGGIAICHVKDLQLLMRALCRNGFEHHVGMTRGAVAGILYEAIHRYLDWPIYHHGAMNEEIEL